MTKVKTRLYLLIEFFAILTFAALAIYLNNSQKILELQSSQASTTEIITFTANPQNISALQSVTLTWNAPQLTNISINNGIGEVDYMGMTVVFPRPGDVYTLTGYLDNKRHSKSIEIGGLTKP